MPLHIANASAVANKVEQLAKATGLSKAACVEIAVDALLQQRRQDLPPTPTRYRPARYRIARSTSFRPSTSRSHPSGDRSRLV
jgi:hypothetical protein